MLRRLGKRLGGARRGVEKLRGTAPKRILELSGRGGNVGIGDQLGLGEVLRWIHCWPCWSKAFECPARRDDGVDASLDSMLIEGLGVRIGSS